MMTNSIDVAVDDSCVYPVHQELFYMVVLGFVDSVSVDDVVFIESCSCRRRQDKITPIHGESTW